MNEIEIPLKLVDDATISISLNKSDDVSFNIEENNIPIEPDIDNELYLQTEDDEDILIQMSEGIIGSLDYRALTNKPSINGTRLIENYDEIDPTVPDWAKGDTPQELPFADIKSVWDSVFNQ